MYESAPHYCIMIPLMMLYLNREVSIGLCCFSLYPLEKDKVMLRIVSVHVVFIKSFMLLY